MSGAGDDTIFALSSGAPPAAIAVLRISGPHAGAALTTLAGRLPAPRRATLRTLREGKEVLDRALVLWFPGPGSATGEDLAELHVHGGRAVASAVLAALGRLEGLRAALPGEFTRRAFANGVIDLAQAEGLADLLAAETEAQRRAAMTRATGALGRRIEQWRARIVDLSAQVEAAIDFADEGDVAVDERAIVDAACEVYQEIRQLLARPPAERLRDGVRVLLAGPPNAGKSTLFNALVGRDAAITAPEPGTTRDLIEAPVVLDGIAYLLIDSAGLRDAETGVERIGVVRARNAMADADLILWLGPPDNAPEAALVIHAKADIDRAGSSAPLRVSAHSGEGMQRLRDALRQRSLSMLPREGELSVNTRQREMLTCCAHALADIRLHDLAVVAEHLAAARSALDRVVGRAGVEDMLDSLFSRFCIGK